MCIKCNDAKNVLLIFAFAADEVVTYRNGEKSADFLRGSGFQYLNFKPYNGYRHTYLIFPIFIFFSEN